MKFEGIAASPGISVGRAYLINEEGKIEEIFGLPDREKVKTKEHAQQIINFWALEA